ncbi:HpcH/HpaI aldolase/citrate lyase family protein [uncultured Sphingomonas sp.]|uniref:HpcH/HpaI aldolase/citrate lyase family protein n=1 Tax=uncultured Sphingomonas sp. TaxID=158754 RepID=UPI0035CC6352
MTVIRPRRSALFLPASNPRAIAKARGSAADVVILDLEDAVAPEAKVEARAAAVAAAQEEFGGREVVIRVNALDTPWGAHDLAACAGAADAVLVPKIAGPDDVGQYDAALAGGSAALWVMIETCLAIARLQPIADRARDTRLSALVVGANDLALEMRARPGPARVELMPLLALTVAAGRSRGLTVLDAVCNDFNDLDRVAAECSQGRRLGFDGKTLIHPAQIDAANVAFAPDAEEVATAARIVAAFADPAAAGRGAIKIDGRMVERLHLLEAERMLALHRAVTPN